jgi:hypothetical protein
VIEMLGAKGKLRWRQSGDACTITIPVRKVPSGLAFTLKIHRP